MKSFNLITNNDDIYGFLPDFIEMFEDNLKEDPDDEVSKLGLENAKRLLEKDEDYFLYKSYYNPMGAFIFTKMVEEKH